MDIKNILGFGSGEAYSEEPVSEFEVIRDRFDSIVYLDWSTGNADYAQFGPDAPAEETPVKHVAAAALAHEATPQAEVTPPAAPNLPITPELAERRELIDNMRRLVDEAHGRGGLQ